MREGRPQHGSAGADDGQVGGGVEQADIGDQEGLGPAPAGTSVENLEIDLFPLRIDGGDNCTRTLHTGGQGSQSPHADARNVPGYGQPLGEGEPDPEAGEGPRSYRDADPVQILETRACVRHGLRQHGREPLLMAAVHGLRAGEDHPAVMDERRLAGVQAGVDGEDPQSVVRRSRPPPRTRAWAHAAPAWSRRPGRSSR